MTRIWVVAVLGAVAACGDPAGHCRPAAATPARDRAHVLDELGCPSCSSARTPTHRRGRPTCRLVVVVRGEDEAARLRDAGTGPPGRARCRRHRAAARRASRHRASSRRCGRGHATHPRPRRRPRVGLAIEQFATPRRTISWSSTRKTRVTVSSDRIDIGHRVRPGRHAPLDRGGARRRFDVEVPPRRSARSRRLSSPLRRPPSRNAGSVVLDDDADHLVARLDGNPDVIRSRVLHGVRQQFLATAVMSLRDGRRSPGVDGPAKLTGTGRAAARGRAGSRPGRGRGAGGALGLVARPHGEDDGADLCDALVDVAIAESQARGASVARPRPRAPAARAPRRTAAGSRGRAGRGRCGSDLRRARRAGAAPGPSRVRLRGRRGRRGRRRCRARQGRTAVGQATRDDDHRPDGVRVLQRHEHHGARVAPDTMARASAEP